MARRADDPKDIYLVIHGHFYQPPRENPWLDTIEREPSAAPFSNWNARIAEECYRVNGWARVFDDRGRMVDLANNYQHMSFNFGATLLTWLERRLPRTYARILEADRLSVEARGGHGNALAQSYGHAILPLCNQRDRLTLIRWGKRDFEARFGRPAEAMWLPETAINADTVEDLIAEQMRFVVLSPYQAHRVRRLGEERWRTVSGGAVDPRMPYRCPSSRHPDKHLDVFFYDGPVSHSISFGEALRSSRQLVDKLWGAVEIGRGGPQLIHSAVDGETFGHHQRHAERALAYALTEEASRRGFTLTNYGEYLERFPPTHEVELEAGPNGEGTAWSCAHGVGRWARDCGCNAGSPEGWNQRWRTPLRQAVDLVRDEAAGLLEELGGQLLKDPWAARDDAVSLLLRPTSDERAAFLSRHARDRQSLTSQTRIFKLLEMQRFALMAQTSCGWFFDDVSGLEAVQVMRYMARAMHLLEDLSGRNLEGRTLKVLAAARSNIPAEGTGAEVYRKRVLPSVVGPRRYVAQYAITDMFRDYPEDLEWHGRLVHRVERHRLSSGQLTLVVGRVEVEDRRTSETFDLIYVLIHFGGHDFHCAVRSFPGTQEFRAFTKRLREIFGRATVTELLRAVDGHFGDDYFGMPQLLAEERAEVLDALFRDMSERFAEMYTRLYMDNRSTVSALIDSGLEVPTEFRIAAEYTLSRQLNAEILAQGRSRDGGRYQRAKEIVQEAEHGNYTLDLSRSEALFSEMIGEAVAALVGQPTAEACRAVLDTLALASSLGVSPDLDRCQEELLELLAAEEKWGSFEQLLGQLLDVMKLSPELLE